MDWIGINDILGHQFAFTTADESWWIAFLLFRWIFGWSIYQNRFIWLLDLRICSPTSYHYATAVHCDTNCFKYRSESFFHHNSSICITISWRTGEGIHTIYTNYRYIQYELNIDQHIKLLLSDYHPFSYFNMEKYQPWKKSFTKDKVTIYSVPSHFPLDRYC